MALSDSKTARAIPAAGRLILGGHSFIGPLGNEPEASADEQHAIVAACLAGGITAFDTTYAPERIAFGRAIGRCDASDRAKALPIIWNFAGRLTDPLPGPVPWTDRLLDEALAELSPWSGAPVISLHDLPDPEANASQIANALRWKAEGRVAGVANWPGNSADWTTPEAEVWDYVIAPWNTKSADRSRPAFQSARLSGRATIGTSPFERGWELDRVAQRVAQSDGVHLDAARATVADAMLRFAVFSPEVDHMIVAMRSAKYVATNLASISLGPLTPEEMAGLIRD